MQKVHLVSSKGWQCVVWDNYYGHCYRKWCSSMKCIQWCMWSFGCLEINCLRTKVLCLCYFYLSMWFLDCETKKAKKLVGKWSSHLVTIVTTLRSVLVSLFSFACFGKQELEVKIEFELSNSSKKSKIFFSHICVDIDYQLLHF